MPLFTFKCTKCDAVRQSELSRDTVQKISDGKIKMICECGAVMERSIKPAESMVQNQTPEQSKTEKLRSNLQKTKTRLDELGNRNVKEGIEKWRQELTGGDY